MWNAGAHEVKTAKFANYYSYTSRPPLQLSGYIALFARLATYILPFLYILDSSEHFESLFNFYWNDFPHEVNILICRGAATKQAISSVDLLHKLCENPENFFKLNTLSRGYAYQYKHWIDRRGRQWLNSPLPNAVLYSVNTVAYSTADIFIWSRKITIMVAYESIENLKTIRNFIGPLFGCIESYT